MSLLLLYKLKTYKQTVIFSFNQILTSIKILNKTLSISQEKNILR